MTFGPVTLARFSETDLLERLVPTCLERVVMKFDSRRLSMFQWLVVQEELSLDRAPEERAEPWLSEPMGDPEQIEPHKGRFPRAVETALFALLLVPWEDWSRVPSWRGFRTPWVHTVVEDVFVMPRHPPPADTLAWDLASYVDQSGETVEFERPFELPLDDAARPWLAAYDDARWSAVESALRSPLFETPVSHFFVRAYLSDDIDEFLAHLTTIEAALGLHADYDRKLRPKPDPHKSLKGPTERVAARIAALLSDCSAARLYNRLFEIRSLYLHGRREVKAISSEERKKARSLARRVVEALVARANEVSAPSDREEFLGSLLGPGHAVSACKRD